MNRSDPPGRRGRILLVEDDADAAYYAVHVLTRIGGFEVSYTPDPAVALQRARSLPWDLVLTDVDLPGMTGAQLMDALRQAVPTLPVAVMTARAAADASLDGLRKQADALLHKPVPPDRLVAVVSALISEQSSWSSDEPNRSGNGQP
jgi:DNA-binding response OmpR family regulator